MKRVIVLFAITFVFAACHNDKKSTIDGQFFGSTSKNIVLEKLSPSSAVIVDSIHANKDGKFSFTLDFTDNVNPTFYNVRLGNQFVPLLIEGGEHIKISALGNINLTYTVEGSKGSELLKEFNSKVVEQTIKIDSIRNLYENAETYEQSLDLSREYNRLDIKFKQAAITFIVNNSTSLAAIVPLYQSSYNGLNLFDPLNEIAYYRVVADSLAKYYPTSPYVTSLRNDIKKVDNTFTMDSIINANFENAASFPDISLNDAAGKMQVLSSLKGKTVLLSFTSSTDPSLKAMNRELLEIYNKYKNNGFEIYEVSIETDKASWLRSITENRLPWIQVSDFKGVNSTPRAVYNVKSLPAYFIIDKDGKLEAVNVKHGQIATELAKIIK